MMQETDEVNEVRFTARNIEKLDISSFGLFEIDCPNLKILNIHLSCREESSYLRGVNIPSVHEVHLQSIDEYDYILNKICKVEVVKFSEDAFQQSIFEEVNIPQTRWNCLHIELSQLNEYQLIGIFRVLRSSPHLEKLIVFSNSQENMKQALGMLSEELSMSSPCVLPLLKTVTIRGYRVACQSQLRLAECLLKSCVTLEKMVILPSTYELVAIEELKFVKRLCSFPRASANARVIYGSEIY
ncbi:uncharacterized protein LOC110706586 isoform X2 [Chenopodium quinoa]|uniref:uncharacterized protein LOC110706586 isoform X2 n=1 Tax=Chenopodium quinoa TaxID=63459 RepID=UPI000B77B2D1|nr:uncharacterized protein LOC110706586 isoform X2 [Chenopodium quinoa]